MLTLCHLNLGCSEKVVFDRHGTGIPRDVSHWYLTSLLFILGVINGQGQCIKHPNFAANAMVTPPLNRSQERITVSATVTLKYVFSRILHFPAFLGWLFSSRRGKTFL